MTGWIIFFALLAGIYVFIILNYLKGWRSLPGWEIPPAFAPQTRVSVLIPARNEALHIARCLESVLNQTYPASLFEVIVLDDHSEDDTFHIVEEISRRQPQVKILRLADFVKSGETQSFKKKALEIGIGQASGELIVTTDADCIAPPEWLMLLVSLFEKNNPVFIAAPLGFHKGKNLLQRFQSLDMLGMMAVTGAGIHHRLNYLCNGANLAYPKVVFQQVNGFEGIDKLASGDDMLLLQKIAGRYPERIEFLKNRRATVLTTAMPDVRSFFSQRLRWASKSASYSDRRVTLILGLVFFYCWAIIASFLFSVCLEWQAAVFAGGLFLVKGLTDYFFLREMTAYFRRKDLMKSFISSQFLHLAYISIVGLLANLIKSYSWKGRRVK